MLQNNNKSIICLGGTDPSGGAGLAADNRTCAALHTLCRPVVTTITAQTHGRFVGDWPVVDDVVLAQLDAALSLDPYAPVKIGALGSRDFAYLGQQLALRLKGRVVVVDPVLGASSGGRLAPPMHDVHRYLLPLATLLTPNLEELSALIESSDGADDTEVEAAQKLISGKTSAILIKGGHGSCSSAVNDVLLFERTEHTFSHPRSSRQARGTGCVLASAICCGLAHELSMIQAVQQAIDFVGVCFESDNNVLVFTDQSEAC